MKLNKTIFWDFNGTLGFPRNGMWGETMIDALKEYAPDTRLVPSDFSDFFTSCFPWHHPERSYTHIKTSEEWWKPILRSFTQGYIHYGFPEDAATKLAENVRTRFIDPGSWSLFDDTENTLLHLKKLGWKHVMVSNHIPELGQIIESLGLNHHLDFVINSALVGYEKPNREIFRHALELSGNPTEMWMIGDDIEADVFGAEALGIKSILVRNMDARASYNCKVLNEVIDIVEG